MDDEFSKDKKIQELERAVELKQQSLFAILVCIGILLLAYILKWETDSLKFFFGSWGVVFLSWTLSKII
jgi:hypothetical protein